MRDVRLNCVIMRVMDAMLNSMLTNYAVGLYGSFLFLIWALTRPVYADFRRRKSGYGVVFNCETGELIAGAVIRFKNPQGSVAATVVSDKRGRYRLVAPMGEYFVEVTKPGFVFTFNKQNKKSAERFFDGVLNSQHVLTQDYGAVTKNIPLVPKLKIGKASFWKRRYGLGKTTQHLIVVLGTGVAFYFAILQNTYLFWAIFAVYLIIMLVRLATFKPSQPPFGTIIDAGSRQPLDRTIVRLLDQRFNKLIEMQTTSPKGRYAFMVNRGAYRLLIEKSGYRKVIVNFPNIKQDGFLLAKDVSMTKSGRLG